MLDLTSTPFAVNFSTSKAEKVTDECTNKTISHGKKKSRMHLIKGNNYYSIAVHSEGLLSPPKLNLIERLFLVVVKIKGEHGQTLYVKVNAQSLRKRLGMPTCYFNLKDANILNQILEYIRSALYSRKHMDRAYIGDTNHYEGSFVNGQLNGLGMITSDPKWKWLSQCEETKVGHFKDGKLEGPGSLRKGDGTEFLGTFVEGNLEGQGMIKFPDHRYLEGNFVKGIVVGDVQITYSDNSVFVGTYENPQMQSGTRMYPDGKVCQGQFKNHELHGEGTITYNNQVFRGQYVDGSLEGFGTITSNGKLVYEGMFKESKKEGQGKFYADGKIYEGEFKSDLVNGICKVTSGETVWEGEYSNGKQGRNLEQIAEHKRKHDEEELRVRLAWGNFGRWS